MRFSCDFYRGQYRSLVSVMEKRWAAFPDKKDRLQEQAAIAGFRGLPNQRSERNKPSTVAHEAGSIFIPISINGKAATYFFDTGAWVSCMSESEARRLHLTIRGTSGTLGQMAGAQVGFRTAVARHVIVGAVEFQDVSFAAFPDTQEPWSELAPGRKGIVGIPLLVGIDTISWERDGIVELGKPSNAFDIQRSNLSFDDDHLVVTASIQNEDLSATVDTGATQTYFYQPFAEKFDYLLKQSGKKDTTDVHGVGHAEKIETVTLPELQIRIGNADTILAPARVLMRPAAASCCVGNFGMDLFRQASFMKIDLGAMTIQLGPTGPP